MSKTNMITLHIESGLLVWIDYSGVLHLSYDKYNIGTKKVDVTISNLIVTSKKFPDGNLPFTIKIKHCIVARDVMHRNLEFIECEQL